MGKTALPKITLRYEGLFDFDGLYAAVVDWAKNYGYLWHEVQYKHKVPSPKGAEQEITWQLTKNVTHSHSFTIVLVTHVWDLVEVEVDSNGKKKSLSNARMYIQMNGIVTGDWQGIFKKSKMLGKIYSKLKSKDADVFLDTLYYRMWNLHSIMKIYFDMQTKKYAYKHYLEEH
jgi:hypothetical protein